MILFGAMFRCVDPILTIAAILSTRSPFVSPLEKRQEADSARLYFAIQRRIGTGPGGAGIDFSSHNKSDHLSLIRAYDEWLQARDKGTATEVDFCQKKFLSRAALKTIADTKRQLAEQLGEIGFLGTDSRKVSIRKMERSRNGDGVLEATGDRFNFNSKNTKVRPFCFSRAPLILPLPSLPALSLLNLPFSVTQMIRAVLTAGLYPNLVRIDPPEARFIQIAPGAVAAPTNPRQLRLVVPKDLSALLTSSHIPSTSSLSTSSSRSPFPTSSIPSFSSSLSGPTSVSLFDREFVHLHPSSVLFSIGDYESSWLVYYQRIRTKKVYIRDATMIFPYPVLLFGGALDVQHSAGIGPSSPCAISFPLSLPLPLPVLVLVLALFSPPIRSQLIASFLCLVLSCSTTLLLFQVQ
jgi:ATP-dependent RNA helicase DHX57